MLTSKKKTLLTPPLLQIWSLLGLHRWLMGEESTCWWRIGGFDPWVRKIPWKDPTLTHTSIFGASLMTQTVKNLSAMQETQQTQVQSLGRKDPLKEVMATCSSISAWEIPWTEKPGELQSIRVAKSWTWPSMHAIYGAFLLMSSVNIGTFIGEY